MLVAERLKRDLSQYDLADRLGRSQAMVAKYEIGERRLDILEFVEVLEALETNPVTFFSRFIKDDKANAPLTKPKKRPGKRNPKL